MAAAWDGERIAFYAETNVDLAARGRWSAEIRRLGRLSCFFISFTESLKGIDADNLRRHEMLQAVASTRFCTCKGIQHVSEF